MSRELVGYIPAVTVDAQASQAAYDQDVRIPITPSVSARDLTVSGSNPDGADQTVGYTAVKINHKREVPITWNGEEIKSMGGMYNPIIVDQYAQAMRTLVNEMEEDIAEEAAKTAVNSGYFVGTAGTTPFASDLKALTKARKHLSDKGAPLSNLQLVMDTGAGLNMRDLTQLQKVNEGGDEELLRRGLLGNLFGFSVRESAGIKTPAIAGSGYLINGAVTAGPTVKQVTVDSGSGKIHAGTIVTFGSAPEQYVVAEDVESGGTTIKLRSAITANIDDNALVVLHANTPCVAFDKSSIVFVERVPEAVNDGKERAVIYDPVSGLAFEVLNCGGTRQNTVLIAAVWGVKTIKPEHTVAILG